MFKTGITFLFSQVSKLFKSLQKYHCIFVVFYSRKTGKLISSQLIKPIKMGKGQNYKNQDSGSGGRNSWDRIFDHEVEIQFVHEVEFVQ